MKLFCCGLLSVLVFASIGSAHALTPSRVGAGSKYDLYREVPMLRTIQYESNPCTDGRYNDGKPRSCRELLRTLERRQRYWERRERYDPCTDGSVSDGRPRTCREIHRWLRKPVNEEEWRPRRDWK
ncbi:hypothetical protein FHW16_005550 [Phyllobacterium myrsinacearum]|uniref:Secreted protein n=1 Tax=Phyllobacterium myrsinacearum TaxID=28101 RepID=A0A839EMJ8_9HYPH|nr:hypothetical protein [Phyllobacterium myrsinacearum]